MKILILNASPESYSTKRLTEEAEKKGHEIEVHAAEDFYLEISNVAGHDKIFLKGEDGKDARVFSNRYDAVIVRITDLSYGSLVVEHLEKNLKKFCTAGAIPLQNASNKFRTCQLLSQAKIRTMKQIIAKHPNDFGFLVNRVDLPSIAKTQTGSKGSGVFILESELSASTTLEAFSKLDQNIILQEFLEKATKEENSHDIRAFVVDQEVVAAYKRYSLDKDFRSNYSLSKQGDKCELSEEEKVMAVDAANAVGLEGIAGVDLMRSDDKTYCVEVNGNPGLEGVETITEINVAVKIIEYVERQVTGGSKSSESNSSHISTQKVNFMSKALGNFDSAMNFIRNKKATAVAKETQVDQLPHNREADRLGYGEGFSDEEEKQYQAHLDTLRHHQEADRIGLGKPLSQEEIEKDFEEIDKLPHNLKADKSEWIPKKNFNQ